MFRAGPTVSIHLKGIAVGLLLCGTAVAPFAARAATQSPSGMLAFISFAYSSSGESGILALDTGTGEEVARIPRNGRALDQDLVAGPDGRYIFLGGRASVSRIDVASLELQTFEIAGATTQLVVDSVSPNGDRVFVWEHDATPSRLLEISTSSFQIETITPMPIQTARRSAYLRPLGQTALIEPSRKVLVFESVGSYPSTLHTLEVEMGTGAVLRTTYGPGAEYLNYPAGLSVSPSGQAAAISLFYGGVALMNVDALSASFLSPNVPDGASETQFVGENLLFSFGDSRVYLVDVAAHSIVRDYPMRMFQVRRRSGALTPDGREFIYFDATSSLYFEPSRIYAVDMATFNWRYVVNQAYGGFEYAGAMVIVPAIRDTTPPLVTCATADGLWHGSNVSLLCSAVDEGSGLANSGDASFALRTSVPDGSEAVGAQTDSRLVCDKIGNCTTAGPIYGNKIDRKPPTISIVAPTAGTLLVGQAVASSYSCVDGGSGVSTCSGPVASGAPIDTSSVGTHAFSVTATDAVGNSATVSVTYVVAYGQCVLFDQTKAHPAGSTIPIKLQLCNAAGNNVSDASIPLVATGVYQVSNNAPGPLEDSGNANPDNQFRFAGGSYIFNLSLKGFNQGTYALVFTAGNDPTLHSVQFQLK